MREHWYDKGILLVEGIDDFHTIKNLLIQQGLGDFAQKTIVNEFFILKSLSHEGGVDSLIRNRLPTAIKSGRSVGVVLDADTDPMARWQSIRTALGNLEYGNRVVLPESPDPMGTITPGALSETKLGIWIMPDNSAPGSIESFLGMTLPDTEPVWKHAETATRKAQELDAPISENKFDKARAHTWLAWQEEPGKPLGQAVTAKLFRENHEVCLRFRDWFVRLFDVPLNENPPPA
ncbi:MAG: hypothetical protein PWP23_3341 [Candidatus Sumerlaeota bacterium]|nr:hypothetical protein [Candidatus Sumerlaeota bacterium]